MDRFGWAKEIAVAFVRASGRCEYCGCDLLHDRLGFAVMELDHLVPRRFKDLIDCPDNWVLSCRLCNGIKRTFNPASGYKVTAKLVRDDRDWLITEARKHIYAQRAEKHDPVWLEVRTIL